ncbi:MAG: hypothetical protein ABR606_07060 [Vicinamibacterales bacterium]
MDGANGDARRDEQTRHDLGLTFKSLLACLVVGLGVVWAATHGAAAGWLWSVACLACGFVVGFLFGVPRVLDDEPRREAGEPGRAEITTARTRHRLAVNTNLTQISDWLTKIIVGVGLVELKQIPDHVARAGEYIGRSLATQAVPASSSAVPATQIAAPSYASLAAAIVVFFSALGFLGGYLLTRMYFSPAFGRADEGLLALSETTKRALQTTPLEQEGRKVEVSATARETASLRRLSLRDVPHTAEGRAIWARAQFDAGRYADAVEGYASALEKNPHDARLRHAYAIALKYAAGNRPTAAVLAEIEKARTLADQQTDLQLRATIYASLTFNALYMPPPGGYETAREAALAYIARPDNLENAEVWFNLASAYGQEHTEQQKAGADPGVLKKLRDEALHALEQAIALEPRLRARARAMIEGKAGEDDDLITMARVDDRFGKAVAASS